MGDDDQPTGQAPSNGPSRWWALASLIPCGLVVAVWSYEPAATLVRLAQAGTAERWLAVERLDADANRSALALSIGAALAVGVVGFAVLRVGLHSWAPDRRRRFGWWWALPWAVAGAGAAQLFVAVLQWPWLDERQAPSAVMLATAALSWWGWCALAAATVGMFGLVWGPVVGPWGRAALHWCTAPLDRRFDTCPEPSPQQPTQPSTRQSSEPSPRPSSEPSTRPSSHPSSHTSGSRADAPPARDGASVGIAVSGGGVRSAAVMIGALRALSISGTFDQARWLHAVSGGGYTAGGWRVTSRHQRCASTDPDSVGDGGVFGPHASWFRHVRRRRRFLDNGIGSLVGGIAAVIVRSVVTLGAVLSASALIGWLVGRLTRSWALHPDFSNSDTGALELSQLLAPRLVLPGLAAVALGGVGVIAMYASRSARWRTQLRPLVLICFALGVGLLIVLVAVPVGIRYGRPLLASPYWLDAEGGAGLLAVLSAIGVVGALRQIATSELVRRWSRLGGVLLLVVLLLFAGKVADDQANQSGVFRGWWVVAVALGWLMVTEFIPSHRLTLNGVYRKRLAETFLPDVDLAHEPRWDAYLNEPGPELVLCGSGHSSKRAVGGLTTSGFTFRPGGVTLVGDVAVPWATYPAGSWWDGYPHGWVVSRSIALAGAAFASAMGRQSYGSTNSLLAAVNFRLGMWVPNPRNIDWFANPAVAPRVHLGYFVKELFNWYRPESDPFVYVADGGHRDNLGLVEQLRERPSEMLVFDASGDEPGSFASLLESVRLASDELGTNTDIDLADLTATVDAQPHDCVARGSVEHPDGAVTTVWYAKALVSEQTPTTLRQYAAAHPPFPDYSTADQFLDEDEFDALVAMGQHLGERLEARRESSRSGNQR